MSVLKDVPLTLTQALHSIAFLTWNALFIWHWGHAEIGHLSWDFLHNSQHCFRQLEVWERTGFAMHFVFTFEHVGFATFIWPLQLCTHSVVFFRILVLYALWSRMHSWPWTLWACTSIHLWLWSKRPGTVVDLCLESFTHFCFKNVNFAPNLPPKICSNCLAVFIFPVTCHLGASSLTFKRSAFDHG